MPMQHILKKAEKFEIQAYQKPIDILDLKNTHVAFTGFLFKHATDKDVVFLLAEPYGNQTFYYEFHTADITYIEELSNIVNLEGEVITITRIWVKKGALGIRCLPFLVADIKII